MFSEKYLAGFVDADGHLSVRARIGSTPDLEFSVSQEAGFQAPLVQMQEMFGGQIRERQGNLVGHVELQLRGSPARKAMERLKKYLVLKQYHAEKFLYLVDCYGVLKSESDVAEVRSRVKEIRAAGASQQPNYPARKWMAGYVDGDATLVVGVSKKSGYAYPAMTIMAAPNYTVGVLLLQKAFGGGIQGIGQNARWSVTLSQPSKIEQVLGFCAPYLDRKKAQAYFLLGCAQGGNLRDGEAIRRTMMALNAQQHRLSDPAAYAADLVKQVRFDIELRRRGRPPA